MVQLLTIFAVVCCVGLAIGKLARSRAVSDWAFAGGMLGLALASDLAALGGAAKSVSRAAGWEQWTLVVLSAQPGLWLLFSLTYARGNARAFLRAWRHALIAAFAVPIGVAFLFRTRLLQPAPADMAGAAWIPHLELPGIALQIAVLGGAVLALMHLERTFRASVGTIRWRIKFMLLGVGVLVVARIYIASQTLLFRVLDLRLETISTVAVIVGTPLLVRAFYRSGRSETQVYPSQLVLQSSFAILLTGIYLLIVGALAKVAAYLGVTTGFAAKAFVVLVAMVLLAMGLQSERIRLRLRRFISRHFQRPLYDYRTVWRKFTEATASRVEENDLCRSLARLIADMFATLSVTIWLSDDQQEGFAFGASTSLSEAKAAELGPAAGDAPAVITHFRQHPEPVDLESLSEPWSNALRRMNPSVFLHGGRRMCVPLIGRGEVLGIICVGDRVSGIPFALQDHDMLKCVADHASANLLNVRLSRRLLQSKELEAFQTMATFFVHDLKNAASTLNLMLENLPVHFDDPDFRQDALRGISKTVGHINRLTGRLTALRHELEVQPVPRDLNDLVSTSLASFDTAAPTAIVRDLQPVAKVLLDREQFQKVLTNLVLNATEATPPGGQVRVSTSQQNGWVILAVADTGCGMSEDFIRRSLFRPFQTTKKQGLGIGMFQTKMIVQAHGGRISVASAVGKGTTFQVMLPASAEKS